MPAAHEVELLWEGPTQLGSSSWGHRGEEAAIPTRLFFGNSKGAGCFIFQGSFLVSPSFGRLSHLLLSTGISLPFKFPSPLELESFNFS